MIEASGILLTSPNSNVLNAKPDLRVFLKSVIDRSGLVIVGVIRFDSLQFHEKDRRERS